MATMIEIDDKVADALRAQASQCELSLPAFLERIAACGAPVVRQPELGDEELARAIDEASDDGPSLPPDFSRADIYLDHD